MLLIPAIDLKNGFCVRLLQGKREEVTQYSDDPASTAKRWVHDGAELIHVVDLDGAFSGEQKNIESIKEIRAAVDVPIEVGGGIRSIERIAMLLSLGVDSIILGTVAVINPMLLEQACEKFPGKIIVGIDAKDGKVAIKGWEEVTEVDAGALSKNAEKVGASAIIYTDIVRDGMLSGPNVSATKAIAERVKIPVIASGGISTLSDIENLAKTGVIYGAITGKAIYSGAIHLKEAIEFVKNIK
ncbi:1-(5-phosphoribosyl)-5-[(5-phosphoribosylamino)methylideneamino]imidazole-4-carboxamide isomerase [Candidatus Magnetomonas plexicatena]|uniref:1-(5-phosphoribosyl)-5-[(5- phosphoribosylamino)methylideneamino]imidazole-4- carboxamide isomerase n=1 Tax=Candidatus Magnetomonas plexicatena TaxID=2552947 RepID=UPI001C76B975|nr:1-(5-phosphoribosyl)-5-[(5-phosphoribosylamino)methylideneamino]imidazole-4-carboxamide isomerase [Nitrospirales bacterium LBB_01]